ncbi:MAG: hypothetical protein [Caudoviricetes sp.]|nr:MAG: hypothetical protein [Caudoviricetes sp.]
MKLIDILVKEFEEWPEGLQHICQNRDGEIGGAIAGDDSWYHPGDGKWYTSHRLQVSEDYDEAKITREMWEEAKAANEDVKPSAEKYIPSLGEKCLTWVERGEDGKWEECVVDHIGDNYLVVKLTVTGHPIFDRAVTNHLEKGRFRPLSQSE